MLDYRRLGRPHRVMRMGSALGICGALLATAACQSDPAPAGTAASSKGGKQGSSAQATPARLTFSPANKAVDVLPDAPITVKASVGSITSLSAKDDRGGEVALADDGSGTWTNSVHLRPNARYTLTAEAKGPDGSSSKVTSSFTTLKPKVTATYGIVDNGQTVGVGMPMSIQFDTPVTTKARRAEVEKFVRVTTSPQQEGAWGWLDSRQLMYRPKTYWQPGTKVSVDANLTGVQTGDGKWVGSDDHGSFTVGPSMISIVNIKTHTMTVSRGGQVIRTIPVSTGKPGPKTETRSGVKVIIRKEGEVTMDSTTVGIPKGSKDYYNVKTKFNLRVTWTGEYLHSAPWSVGSQGSANVSHGCTNMSPANAQWMFQNSKVGDVVKFVGSSRVFQPAEGIGVWQYTYEEWEQQSALV